MAEIIRGAQVAQELKEQMKETIERTGVHPCLGIVRVGENASDLAYERGVRKTCEGVGIELRVFVFREDITQKELEDGFAGINADPEISGILLFRPLPKHLDDKPLAQMIDPEKDMDCMSPANWAKLAVGDESGYAPCTAEAVVKIAEYAGVDLVGANVTIIGRSLVIGRPLGLMMIARHATVTWCHSRTKDLPAHCAGTDVLVSACGVAGLVGKAHAEHLAEGCVAIDVGMNFVDGKMCGDFAFDEVEPYAEKITPVPGGVGSVTNTVLASHVVRAAVRAQEGMKK